MSAADPFDDMVEEMQPETEAEETPAVEAAAEEPAAEPVEPAPEPEPEPAVEEPVEPVAASAEPEPTAELEAPATPEPDVATQLEAEKKRADALKDELAQMRAKARMAQARHDAPQAPNPAAAPTPVPTAQPGAQPAEVGTGIIYENGQARIDPAFIQAQWAEANRPDPQAEIRQREDQMRQQFVGMDDGSTERAATFRRADEAMEYLNLKLWNVAQETGADLGKLGVEGLVQTARDVGIMAEVEANFPDVAPHITDFLIAGTLPPGHGELAMRSALSRYHDGRVATPAAAPAAATLPNTATVEVRGDRPPSIAAQGQAPSGDNVSSKSQREIELTNKLSDDPMEGLSATEQSELDGLRADLGL